MNELDGWTKVDVELRRVGRLGLRTSLQKDGRIAVYATKALAEKCTGAKFSVFSKGNRIALLPDGSGRTLGMGHMPTISKGLELAGLKLEDGMLYAASAINGDIRNGFEVCKTPEKTAHTPVTAARKAINLMQGILDGDPETWGKIVLACARNVTDPGIVNELSVSMSTVKKIRNACAAQIERIRALEAESRRDEVKGILKKMVDQWAKEAAKHAKA